MVIRSDPHNKFGGRSAVWNSHAQRKPQFNHCQTAVPVIIKTPSANKFNFFKSLMRSIMLLISLISIIKNLFCLLISIKRLKCYLYKWTVRFFAHAQYFHHNHLYYITMLIIKKWSLKCEKPSGNNRFCCSSCYFLIINIIVKRFNLPHFKRV